MPSHACYMHVTNKQNFHFRAFLIAIVPPRASSVIDSVKNRLGQETIGCSASLPSKRQSCYWSLAIEFFRDTGLANFAHILSSNWVARDWAVRSFGPMLWSMRRFCWYGTCGSMTCSKHQGCYECQTLGIHGQWLGQELSFKKNGFYDVLSQVTTC
jgi:hypothetical protein